MKCCEKNLKTKQRSQEEMKLILNRLNRIEGQIKGVKGMIAKDAYCVDILTQISAVNSALNSLSRLVLTEHIKSCVTDDIRAGKNDTVDELMNIMKKFMK